MKLFNWINPKNWGIVKVYRDFENFADWKQVVQKELANKNSIFRRWNISHTKLYDLYVTVSLDEADNQLPEVVKRTKVMEMLNPLNIYLDEDLGFAGCLTCEFNQFVDNENKPTFTYLIVYRFNFEKFSLLWILKSIGIIALIAFIIVHFNLIPILLTWLKTLV